ncbi:MAG: hypothetical protein VB143_06570 [Burkholderia sp.]
MSAAESAGNSSAANSGKAGTGVLMMGGFLGVILFFPAIAGAHCAARLFRRFMKRIAECRTVECRFEVSRHEKNNIRTGKSRTRDRQ